MLKAFPLPKLPSDTEDELRGYFADFGEPFYIEQGSAPMATPYAFMTVTGWHLLNAIIQEKETQVVVALITTTYALVRQLMCRYRMRQGETISYENLCDTLRRTRFTLLRHIKTGELYGMPNIKASPRAENLYRIVGLKCSSAPFKL